MGMMGYVPNWVIWLWVALVSWGVISGFIARFRTKDSQKRTNNRLEHIETQLNGFAKMEGKVDSMRDDVSIIKRHLIGEKK